MEFHLCKHNSPDDTLAEKESLLYKCICFHVSSHPLLDYVETFSKRGEDEEKDTSIEEIQFRKGLSDLLCYATAFDFSPTLLACVLGKLSEGTSHYRGEAISHNTALLPACFRVFLCAYVFLCTCVSVACLPGHVSC